MKYGSEGIVVHCAGCRICGCMPQTLPLREFSGRTVGWLTLPLRDLPAIKESQPSLCITEHRLTTAKPPESEGGGKTC